MPTPSAPSPATPRGSSRSRAADRRTPFSPPTATSPRSLLPVEPLPERPSALFVGVLEPYKNVDGLTEALAAGVAAGPEGVRWTIVGKGSRPEAGRRRSPMGSRRTCGAPPTTSPGNSTRRLCSCCRRVTRGSAACDQGVRTQAWSVASRAGGILDLVDDGREGLLVDPEDTTALAEALVRVLSDPALAERLGAAAHERFHAGTRRSGAVRQTATAARKLGPRLGPACVRTSSSRR